MYFVGSILEVQVLLTIEDLRISSFMTFSKPKKYN